MHYGEIFDVWAFSSKAKLSLSCYQAYMYHAGDKDLKEILHDMIDQETQAIKDCDTLLLDNGIAPPPSLPVRPEAKFENIPVGARFTDQEIAAHIGADISMGLVACSQIMGMSTREDIGALFAKYHTTKTTHNARILRLNKDKGWLIPPPLHVKTPEYVEA